MMADWKVIKQCAKSYNKKKRGPNNYMKTMKACGYKESRTKNPIPNGVPQVGILSSL